MLLDSSEWNRGSTIKCGFFLSLLVYVCFLKSIIGIHEASLTVEMLRERMLMKSPCCVYVYVCVTLLSTFKTDD
jgi:hypothetical protein